MDINNQKLIYFYSPMGTYTRVNKNLEYLGLDNNKKVGNTYTRDFIKNISNNTYIDKYKNIDVLILDEFYDYTYIEQKSFANAMQKLIEEGKQIVMAGHKKIEDIIPKEIQKQITTYDLNYDLDWNYNYQIDYI